MKKSYGKSGTAIVLLWGLVFWLALSFVGESVEGTAGDSYVINPRDKLIDAWFVDRKTGFAVGNKGLVLSTKDQGETWQHIATDTNEALNAVTFEGTKGWIVGGSGIVLHSADGGAQWTKQESGCAEAFTDIYSFDESRLMAIGTSGAIVVTEDGGATWERHPFAWESNLPACAIEQCILSPILYDIYFVDELRGWIVGEKGTVMSTEDGGKEWALLDVGNYPSLYAVYFRDAKNGIAVGKDMTFLTSADGGKTWDKKVFPPSPLGYIDFYDIQIEDKHGIIVGDRSLVLLSKDGGKHWMPSMALMQPPLPFLLGACLIPEILPKQACIVGAGTVVKLPLE